MTYFNDEYDNYIVKAPKLKKGEKASSGGLRKDGQMVVQYFDPVPYQEPKEIVKSTSQAHIEELLVDIGSELLYIGWEEFGEPVVRNTLSMFKEKVISRIADVTLQPKALKYKEYEIIDVPSDNIIDFPFEKVG